MFAYTVLCFSHQSDRRVKICISHQSDCRIRVLSRTNQIASLGYVPRIII